MISTVEVIEKSKAISDIGLEIQTLNNAYANHAKAMSETMEKIKELKAKQDELARNLIQECNKPLTVALTYKTTNYELRRICRNH